MTSEWKSERREYPRKDVGCSVTVKSDSGEQYVTGRTMNMCDDGAMFTVPIAFLASLPTTVNLSFALPRETANTHMVEQVATEATIVRQEPMTDDAQAGVAVRFTMPIDLQLEV